MAQVPAFGKIRQQQQQQRKLSTREKVKYEYRMMTTAFSGRLPIVAADPAEAKVRLSGTCLQVTRSVSQVMCAVRPVRSNELFFGGVSELLCFPSTAAAARCKSARGAEEPSGCTDIHLEA